MNVTIDGKQGKRETSTMPGSAGSSWYFLRYIDPHTENEIADKKLLEHWMPVDLYVGGPEHAVGHLLYSRMWNNYLYDKGLVSCKEPFQKLFNQGMILGEGNEKMSKSKGNVVNPDDIVTSHGADTLRLYEMFMGPLDASVAWSTNGLDGARRFLDRTWRLFMNDDGTLSEKIVEAENTALDKVYHETVKKVTDDFENLHFNTGISQMMVFINEGYKADQIPKAFVEGFVKMLSPVAPHIAEELWEQLGHSNTITYEEWPVFDASKLVEDEVEVVLQVMGKVRSKLSVPKDISKEDLEKLALADEGLQQWIEGKTIRKVIVVPGKLVNVVAN